MSTGWYGSRVIELINVRSLFVKVWPTPTSFTERRAVLRALQRYGDIEVFKRLTEPDTFICATARADTANALVGRSPLTFRFMSESLQSIQAASQPVIPPSSVAAPVIIHEEEQSDNGAWDEAPDKDEEPSDLIKTFTLRIEPSQNHYEHKRVIRLNPLHGPWPESVREDEDFASAALQQVVPKDLAAPGFFDWHTAGQLVEDTKHIRLSKESSQEWHVAQRFLRRKSRRAASWGEETLVAWTSVDDIIQQVTRPKNDGSLFRRYTIGERVFSKSRNTTALQDRPKALLFSEGEDK